MATRLRLVTADGVRLDGCHWPRHNGVPSDRASADRPLADSLGIVIAHGFTGSWQTPAIGMAADVLRGYGDVFAFDFRGHGDSAGRSTVGDLEVLDLDAVVRQARDSGLARVATVGFSMGASIVLRHAALHRGVDAAVSVSGPGRWFYRGTPPMRRAHWVIERRAGRAIARLVLRTKIASSRWDPIPVSPTEAAAQIAPTPLLVVHGDQDPYFPLDHAQDIYAAAGEPKELWIEPGYGHAEGAADAGLLDRIGRWLTARANGGGG
ncbi:MAG: alpha/beta hydrolase [Sporichthyaceae bacterium]|nr:alpha/beta hydrolase [Sporichthyaceae bacterium]